MWFRCWRSSFPLCRFSQFEGWTSEPRWECSQGQRAWCTAQWWPGPAGLSPSPSPSSTKAQGSLEHQGQVSLHPAHHCHCQCQPLFPEVWSLQRVTALCTPPHQAQPEHLKYNFSSMKRRRYYVHKRSLHKRSLHKRSLIPDWSATSFTTYSTTMYAISIPSFDFSLLDPLSDWNVLTHPENTYTKCNWYNKNLNTLRVQM